MSKGASTFQMIGTSTRSIRGRSAQIGSIAHLEDIHGGEWDFGGFPAWLLGKANMTLRTHNKPYLDAVDKFWIDLLPRFKRRLYSNGGPIVMVQLENEFGDYGDCSSNENDAAYMRHLYSQGDAAPGDVSYLYDGVAARNFHKASPWRHDARVLATIDGPLSSSYDADFALQKKFNAQGNSPKDVDRALDGLVHALGR